MIEIIKVREFFSEFGITMSDVENKLSEIKPNDGQYFNEDGRGSGYQMPLYFSAVSLILRNVTNILEIGAGRGNITNLLAHLFPAATVYAIDLPASDKDYKNDCWRNDKGKLRRFEKNISRDNIKYIEKNSFFLPSMELPRQFDLIYVDGGHYYPVVAWDVMFTYNNLRSDGFAFFHDYSGDGTDVKEVIEYIKDLINEEIKIGFSHMPSKGGYVAWFRKLAKEEIK